MSTVHVVRPKPGAVEIWLSEAGQRLQTGTLVGAGPNEAVALSRAVWAIERVLGELRRRLLLAAPVDADIWQQALAKIEARLTRRAFAVWFRDLTLVNDEISSITVRAPRLLQIEWIEKHLGEHVQAALDDVRPGTTIRWVADERGPS